MFVDRGFIFILFGKDTKLKVFCCFYCIYDQIKATWVSIFFQKHNFTNPKLLKGSAHLLSFYSICDIFYLKLLKAIHLKILTMHHKKQLPPDAHYIV